MNQMMCESNDLFFLLVCQAEVLSQLSHSNIIQFYGAVTEQPNYCIVTGNLIICI